MPGAAPHGPRPLPGGRTPGILRVLVRFRLRGGPLFGVLALALLPACNPAGDSAVPPVEAEIGPPVDPVGLAARASLDLRGTRPSEADLLRVEADPTVYRELVDTYLHDDRFPDRVGDLFAETTLTRTAAWDVVPPAELSDATDKAETRAFLRDVGDEAPNFMARIARDDLPYTDLVTGDWAVTTDLLAPFWPVEYPEGATGWQVSRYTDDRPAAGLLTANGLWWRYTSTTENANRGRANAVARIFVCHDIVQNEAAFDADLDLLDAAAMLHATRNVPSCISCHAVLDPIGSYLFGFFNISLESGVEAATYHTENEQLWRSYTTVEPAFYGKPGNSIWDLGQQLADDPRFLRCAAKRTYEGLLRHPETLDDRGPIDEHLAAFVDGDLTLRALYASIVNDPRYRPGEATVAGAAPIKQLGPEQMESSVEELTGFVWTQSGFPMLRDNTDGVHMLAGGVDGQLATLASTSPSPTILLVMERLAEGGAATVVANELAMARADRVLFTEIDPDTGPEADAAAFTAQLRVLTLRITSRNLAADDEEILALQDLWSQLFELTANPTAAWTGVVTALLRSPDFLLY